MARTKPYHRTFGALVAGIMTLSTAATAETDEPDPYMLGRAQALMDQADQVLDRLDGVETVEAPVSEAPRSDYARLYNATLDLERLRARACDTGRLSGRWCSRRYSASWLKVPTAVHPGPDEVTRWSARFAWPAIDLALAICALAPPDPGGGLVCSTE
jgi:hypothetical protein